MSLMKCTENTMIRNISKVFYSADGRINQRKKEKRLQRCATRIDAVFRPFLVDTSINRKKILDSFLKSNNLVKLVDACQKCKT